MCVSFWTLRFDTDSSGYGRLATMSIMLQSQNSGVLSLADVFPSCLSSLGSLGLPNPLKLASCTTSIVVMIDGLGSLQLDSAKAHARFMSGLQSKEKIVSVFPSTTASALSSLVTGALPGQHGILGYKIRDPHSGLILNQLTEIDKVSTTPWLLQPLLCDEELRQKIPFTVIGHSRFASSPLTQLLYQGARYISENNVDKRIDKAITTADTTGGLCLIYISELDEIAHKEGFQSSPWSQCLESIDAAIKNLVSQVSSGTGILITADHGIVDIPTTHHVLLGDQTVFDSVVAWGGEPRCVQLFVSEGADADDVLNSLKTLQLPHVSFFSQSEVIASNVFGELNSGAQQRLGDIFAIAHDGFALYNLRDAKLGGRSMVGQHGGLTDQEMCIPCLVAGEYAS
jgi:hypothetical protein